MKIRSIFAREILDSRGQPTTEVDVTLDNGILGRFSTPAGASVGRYEALEHRDGDRRRFHGLGVQKVVETINTVITPALLGYNSRDQTAIDEQLIRLDGTSNKSRLGANATLPVSVAVAKAAAEAEGVPLYRYLTSFFTHRPASLPTPVSNLINGGRHATNDLDCQEFLLIPFGFDKAVDAIRAGDEIYQELKNNLHDRGLSTAVGDEGGFAPDSIDTETALDIISEAIAKTDYQLGGQVALGLDWAASELYLNRQYILERANKRFDREDFLAYLHQLAKRYGLVYFEDPLDEEDWVGWQYATDQLEKFGIVVGDDLFTTNPSRLSRGIELGLGHSIIIKPNQVGTLSEIVETINQAALHDYRLVVAHRSGDTEDVFIVHLAVACGAEGLKIGGFARAERTAKYNELLRIGEMSPSLKFQGGRLIGQLIKKF